MTHSNPVPASGKIQGHHRDRQAVVYVRQSTLQQVARHQESTRLQYGLVDRAVSLGWPRTQVAVIDDDLGKSGSSAEGRPGFQRLVAAVSLEQVGIVLGIEMSRLARSCRDWHQLLEVCALFGTLIGDLDGVYDPRNYNDRLLLGLKGTMSEAELHVLKQRMLAGKLAKAGRGELGMRLPMGYVRRPSGEVAKDPDEQARAAIQTVFDQFERLGTLNGVLQYLVRNQIQLPCRIAAGAGKGELEWHRPNRATLSNLLHHPIYAGAYAYGRRPSDPRRQQPGRPGTGRAVAKPEECQVLLQDRLPAYISWEQFTRNQKQLEANNAQHRGPVRSGPSLLPGLLVCGRCGLRMTAQYTQNGKSLRYVCSRAMTDYGEPLCQSLAGSPLDREVGEWVLKALEPAALEVSLQVAQDLEAERQQLHRHWALRLERARYQVDRAFRQYNAVDPENRLVARTLERQWENALAEEECLKAEYAELLARQPPALSERECEEIRRLASDIPALWHAATTTAEDRQAIVRQLVERVVVTVQGESERVDVQIHWRGGTGTRFCLVRPVARLDQLSYYPQLLARSRALHEAGNANAAIAGQLNAEGWRPAKRRDTFTAEMAGGLLARQGLPKPSPASPSATVQREPGEWTLPELAYELAMPPVTLYRWLKQGKLKARQGSGSGHPVWLVQADADELARLRSWRDGSRPHPKSDEAC
jgi:DNA invertase Pin-like site-specific DNA recombinase